MRHYFLFLRSTIQIMKRSVVLLVLIFAYSHMWAQNQQFDKLEMFFDQGHYKKVYRKANRLLDNPEYDFSLLPEYYKSLSLLQLAHNTYLRSRHPNALDRSIQLFKSVKRSPRSEKLFDAHLYELSWLKNDLMSWAADLNRLNEEVAFTQVQEFIGLLPRDVPLYNEKINSIIEEGQPLSEVNSADSAVPSEEVLTVRDGVVIDAKKYIGTPYVWAGNTPEGFDCSGFTRYVMLQQGTELPRRAADQYANSRQLKKKHVQQGDLVFFDNGSGISHVGIVAAVNGDQIVMIHASSSQGVILTDVSASTYWSKRLKGFGTYLE